MNGLPRLKLRRCREIEGELREQLAEIKEAEQNNAPEGEYRWRRILARELFVELGKLYREGGLPV